MNEAWQVVLAQITEWEHAAALMRLFEGHDGTVFANDMPISHLVPDFEVLSERGLAMFLAAHLNELDRAGWLYSDFYSSTRGRDATDEHVADLVARCRAAGVTLVRR